MCSATGNANLTEPEGGWNYTALQTIFSQRVLTSQTAATTGSVSTAPSPSNAEPSAPDHKSSPNEPKKHTGAIAGGVAAGVVVLIVAFLLYRMRASKARRQQSTDPRRDEGTRVESPETNPVPVSEVPSREPLELEPGYRSELSETNPIPVFELPSHEPPELESRHRFELSENPVNPPSSRLFELPGR